MSETCRVLFQNKFEKLTHLVGFYYKKRHFEYTSILLKCDTSTYKRLYYIYIVTQDLIMLYVTVYLLSSFINL